MISTSVPGSRRREALEEVTVLTMLGGHCSVELDSTDDRRSKSWWNGSQVPW